MVSGPTTINYWGSPVLSLSRHSNPLKHHYHSHPPQRAAFQNCTTAPKLPWSSAFKRLSKPPSQFQRSSAFSPQGPASSGTLPDTPSGCSHPSGLTRALNSHCTHSFFTFTYTIRLTWKALSLLSNSLISRPRLALPGGLAITIWWDIVSHLFVRYSGSCLLH